MSTSVQWSLVVPVKRLHLAKTRLRGDAPGRAAMALAFACDTVTAALATPGVAAVIVVTDDDEAASALRRLGAEITADAPDSGLNPALSHGAAEALRMRPECGVGALSADLPALRSAELARALQRVAISGRAVVADAAGTGTTAYLAAPGQEFAPAFGCESLLRHVDAGARVLAEADLMSVRRDVDTAEDLAEAIALGVGTHTAHLLAGLRA